MVVELTGSMLIMLSAGAAGIVAAGVMIDAANTYGEYAISNVGVEAWDRFGTSHLVWIYVTMTYPGGPLEFEGDINLCLETRDGGSTCDYSGMMVVTDCASAPGNKTVHDCQSIQQAGSALQIQYEGVVNVGFDAKRGDTLGYIIRGPLHSVSGVVEVR